MKRNKIIDAMGNVDDRFIEEAADREKMEETLLDEPEEIRIEPGRTKKRFVWMKWAGSAVAVLAIAFSAVTSGKGFRKAESAETTMAGEAAMTTMPTAAADGWEDAAEEAPAMIEDMFSAIASTGNQKEKQTLDDGNSVPEFAADNAGGLAEAPKAAPVEPEDASHVFLPGDPELRTENTVTDMASDFRSIQKQFVRKTAPVLLGDETEENKLYAPSSLYLALSMLAELADGNSRKQITELLGETDMTAVRRNADSLWNNSSLDNENATLLSGSALWLRNDLDYREDVLQILADCYHANCYAGEMGSAAMNECYRDWLRTMTGGLLDQYASSKELDPETVLCLDSTLYFKAAWRDAFSADATKQSVFYGTKGNEKNVEFMNQDMIGAYFADTQETFSAVSKKLRAESMWFVLPGEGISAETLLGNEVLYELVSSGNETYARDITGITAADSARISLSVPKFDVSIKTDLIEGLGKLGLTDIFDPGQADFGNLTDREACYVSSAEQAARLKIDENGCEASSYTEFGLEAGGILRISQEIDFTLDRPFLFFLTNDDGTILFEGIVNHIR